MQIVLLTLGSRGDVQPLVALGVGLAAMGHKVRIATHENFRCLVTRWGLDFSPLYGDSRALIASEEVQRIFELGQGLRWLQAGAAWLAAQHDQLGKDCLTACEGAEAIVYTTVTYPCWHIAQAQKVPAIAVCYWPTTPTSAFPYPLFGAADLGPLNWLSYRVFEQLVWQPFARNTNAFRTDRLGLPPVPAWGPYWMGNYQALPWLYPYSQSVMPRPADWPDHQHVTGYWFLDTASGWTPPSGLVQFLEAGEPPVAVGFGSMIPRASHTITRKVLDAVILSGRRAVLLSGWGGLEAGELPDNCYQVDDVPHDWLLPRVAAVITHGGVGTVGAALRAGKPLLGVPIIGDQYLWSRRVAELGAGLPPIPLKELTAENLAQALIALSARSDLALRASELGAAIQSEDGVAVAVTLVEGYLKAGGRTSIRQSITW